MLHHRLPIKDDPQPGWHDESMIECDCGHNAFPEEVRDINAKTLCPNCKPTLEDRLNDALDRLVAWIEGWFK